MRYCSILRERGGGIFLLNYSQSLRAINENQGIFPYTLCACIHTHIHAYAHFFFPSEALNCHQKFFLNAK